MSSGRGVTRWAGRSLVVGCVVLATACSAPEPKQANDEPPQLGWLLPPTDGVCRTVDEVRRTADRLVASGLAEAGYRTVFVVCDDARQLDLEPTDRTALEAARIALAVIGRADRRVTQTLGAQLPATDLQRGMTQAAIAADPIIVAGDSRVLLSPEQRAVLTNHAVLAVVLDRRRVPGGSVGGGGAVAARAIGEKGIVVSLINAAGAPHRITVAIADLNLAGDDSVPATELWTGVRQVAVDGELGADLPAGGSALLRVGR
ncbi:MAG: hypothetical protein WAW85_01310 [Gordonia sp. (in: high G+C Gram-positive bacteria)]|uniref:alpha-galactosidase n=1 Tax=Gordonia sp. (in: high G+C Gram-positive bacteria) TaxID=84139 RepID=UPI003BB7C739